MYHRLYPYIWLTFFVNVTYNVNHLINICYHHASNGSIYKASGNDIRMMRMMIARLGQWDRGGGAVNRKKNLPTSTHENI
jgi:hypothetical protein